VRGAFPATAPSPRLRCHRVGRTLRFVKALAVVLFLLAVVGLATLPKAVSTTGGSNAILVAVAIPVLLIALGVLAWMKGSKPKGPTAPVGERKCLVCKEGLQDEAAFCPSCGTSQPKKPA